MDTNDDPFALPDPERTIILPTPGGGGRTSSDGRRWADEPRAGGGGDFGADRSDWPGAGAGDGSGAGRGDGFGAEPAAAPTGLNPLVAAANPLLDLVPQLRATARHPDPQGLRDRLAEGVVAFEQRARAAGIAPERIVAARYALCTLLDETATSTPWGSSGVWSERSLLGTFHNERVGGEKFFQLLARLAEEPAANIELLELFYVCLALGFEGRYRVAEGGAAQLAQVRERLALLIRQQRGAPERELSPHWQGVPVRQHPLLALLPAWVVAAVCGALLLAVYLALSSRLAALSDPVFSRIHALRPEAAPTRPPAPAPMPPAASPRLAALLAPEIAARWVSVHDAPTRSVVTLHGDDLFAPGSAAVAPGYEPRIERVARALAASPGRVVVTGHTDNRPITSARFPSNWHLSQERARSVARLLAASGVAPERLAAEGRADAEPIASNDTPADRARNRRVEITLLAEPGAPARPTTR